MYVPDLFSCDHSPKNKDIFTVHTSFRIESEHHKLKPGIRMHDNVNNGSH